jgi:transposase
MKWRPRPVHKRDVAALAEANRAGVYRPAHRTSAGARHLRQTMRVRHHLVQMRGRTISLVRALLRREGLRLPNGSAACVLDRLDRLPAA